MAGIRLAGTLEGGAEGHAVFRMKTMDDRIGNRAVDGVEHVVIEDAGLEREVENLDFRHAGSGRQAEGFRRELVRPDDFGKLRDKEIPHPPRRSGVGVDAALGNGFPEGGLWRKGEHIKERGHLAHDEVACGRDAHTP